LVQAADHYVRRIGRRSSANLAKGEKRRAGAGPVKPKEYRPGRNSARRPGKKGRLLPFLRRVTFPHPFNSVREELRLSVANTVAGTAAKYVLIFVTLLLEYLGHPVIGFHPVVHPVAHHIGV